MKSLGWLKVFLLLLPLAMLCVQILNVQAAAGTLYVNPLTTNVLASGATFSVGLKVSNMDPFNGWDIIVKTNNSVITPQSLSISGNILAANYSAFVTELINCINGGVGIPDGSPGNKGCTSSDGPGIARSAATVFGQISETNSLNGLLFNVTYKVSGLGEYSSISIIQDQISTSSGHPVTQTPPSEGTYGTPPPQNFGIFPDQPLLNVTQGQSGTVTLMLNSVNLSGTATFSVALSVNGSPVTEENAKVNFSFIPSSLVLKSGQRNSTTMKISTRISTAAYQYLVTVNATIGSLTHSAYVTVTVLNPPDFSIGADPGLLRIRATDTGATIIMLQSNHDFSGNVALQYTVLDAVTGKVPTGVGVSYNVTTLRLASDGTAISALTVTTPPSNLPFKYIITTTASGGGLSRSIDVVVQPPPPNLGFDVMHHAVSEAAGSSQKLNVTLTSLDYFQGPVYLFATTFSGMKLSFSPSRVDFDLGNKTTTANVVLTVTTDPTTALGLHFIVLTASSASLTRFSNVTLTVLAPTSPIAKVADKNILGLAPSTYFGILGALAAILLLVTIIEVRRVGQPSRLL